MSLGFDAPLWDRGEALIIDAKAVNSRSRWACRRAWYPLTTLRQAQDERGRKVTRQPFTLSLGFDAALRGGGKALTIDAKAVNSRSRW